MYANLINSSLLSAFFKHSISIHTIILVSPNFPLRNLRNIPNPDFDFNWLIWPLILVGGSNCCSVGVAGRDRRRADAFPPLIPEKGLPWAESFLLVDLGLEPEPQRLALFLSRACWMQVLKKDAAEFVSIFNSLYSEYSSLFTKRGSRWVLIHSSQSVGFENCI